MILEKEYAEKVVKESGGSKKRIQERLKIEGIDVADCTEKGSPFFNLKIWNEDGSMIRIYRSYSRRVEVQKWSMVKIQYSGIPVFEPGDMDTLFKEKQFRK